MKVLVVQHVPLEGPGLLARTLRERGWELDIRVMGNQNSKLPVALVGYQALLILGGPMGAYEEEQYPYLFEVEALIREGVEKSLPVLGICLGGQLIARAFGATVRPNVVKEIGWYPVFLTERGKETPCFSHLPETFPVFQWHGDTFSLPREAVLLAEGKVCRNQAFLYREWALALQFHPEITPGMVRTWVRAYAEELVAFGGVMAPRELEIETARCWRQNREIYRQFVGNLCDFLEGKGRV